MKNIVKWLIIAVVLVGIIAGASVLYNKLSNEFSPNNFMESTQQQNTEEYADVHSAPDFTVLDYDGNKVMLSDFKGKPVVVNFWATWCYYCTKEMPDFNEAYEKYPDVQFLMVNATDGIQETVSVAKKYIEQENYKFDVFFDTEQEAVNAYSVTSFPCTFFIDKDGNLVTYANGMISLELLEKGIAMITE